MPSNNRGRRTQGREERGMMIVTSRPVRATPAEPLVVIAEAFTEAHENQSNHANTIKQLKARIKELEKGSKSKNKEIKSLEKMNEDTTKQLREAYDWKAVEDLPKAVVEKFSLDVSNTCAKKFGYETMALMWDDHKGKVINPAKHFQEARDLGYIKYHEGDGNIWSFTSILCNGKAMGISDLTKKLKENKDKYNVVVDDLLALSKIYESEKKAYQKDIASLNEALEEVAAESEKMVKGYNNGIDQFVAEDARLEAENKQLKEENQKLKDYIALSEGAPTF